jgi:Asp-tRNA(Asn)/Glu-tRNA(Gln) amidotransferase A subunit family amidase
MPHSDPTSLLVHELSAAFQAKRLSPIDVVEAYLARIETRDPKLQAFVAVYAADAGSRRRPPTRRSAPAIRWDRCTASRSP